MTRAPPSKTGDQPPSRFNVMLCEDEPLVTMTYEDVLAGTEFNLAAVLLCNNQAIEWLNANMPDIAIVDYVLGDGPCHAVVEKLRSSNVPFMVVSGAGDPPDKDLLGAPWLSKPFRGRKLLKALRALPPVYTP